MFGFVPCVYSCIVQRVDAVTKKVEKKQEIVCVDRQNRAVNYKNPSFLNPDTVSSLITAVPAHQVGNNRDKMLS